MLIINNRNNNKEMKLKRIINRTKLNLKSLEDIWFCLVIAIIQIVCIYKACISLNKYSGQSWLPNKRPNNDLWTYTFMILISIVLLPLLILTSLIKIGSYANDNFKIGYDLDVRSLISKFIRSSSSSRDTNNGTFVKSLFSTKHLWKHFMPVSCLLHLIISFCLLYPRMRFTSKEIEYGLRPKGKYMQTCLFIYLFKQLVVFFLN
jgi:hypothetical protein